MDDGDDVDISGVVGDMFVIDGEEIGFSVFSDGREI